MVSFLVTILVRVKQTPPVNYLTNFLCYSGWQRGYGKNGVIFGEQWHGSINLPKMFGTRKMAIKLPNIE